VASNVARAGGRPITGGKVVDSEAVGPLERAVAAARAMARAHVEMTEAVKELLAQTEAAAQTDVWWAQAAERAKAEDERAAAKEAGFDAAVDAGEREALPWWRSLFRFGAGGR
jgi:hypothetical protein